MPSAFTIGRAPPRIWTCSLRALQRTSSEPVRQVRAVAEPAEVQAARTDDDATELKLYYEVWAEVRVRIAA